MEEWLCLKILFPQNFFLFLAFEGIASRSFLVTLRRIKRKAPLQIKASLNSTPIKLRTQLKRSECLPKLSTLKLIKFK